MFKPAEKAELNQISLTGMRGLVIIGLLMEAPRTLEEIRAKLIELNILEQEHSNDILRIDLNTLRAMGCEITHANAKTNFKYVLLKHPFSLNITEEEIGTIKKSFKKIKDSANISLLLGYDALFKKLANYAGNDTIKEELYGLSAFKSYNIELIKQLMEDCKNNIVITLKYKNPSAEAESVKEILAQKVVFQNDKVYLYGYDINKKDAVILNLLRIRAILSRAQGNGIEVKSVCVKYFLKSFGVNILEENETIIETRSDGYIIEGRYHNEFVAVQRVLSFGANCTVLEPADFREKIIQKLKNMSKNYNN